MNELDSAVLRTLNDIREPIGVSFFSLITELGGVAVIVSITLVSAAYLLWHGRRSAVAGLIVSVGGSAIVVFFLKEIVARARPDAMYQAVVETGFSFPSGHTALSVALYGFLIYLLSRYIPAQRFAAAASGLLNLLIILIVFSRLYLGVHYLSDVLVGALIGGLFLAAGICISERFRQPVSSP